MAQTGWERGAQVRLRKGGRRVVHVLLSDVGPSSKLVRRIEVVAWRGELGLPSSSTTTINRTIGITPIKAINRVDRLSRLSPTKANLRRVTRQVSLFLAGVS